MTDLAYQYAVALFSLSVEQKKASDITPSFDLFLKVYEGDLEKILLHPKIGKTEKKDIIQSLKLEPLFRDFLFVLIDKSRMEHIRDIKESYQHLLDEQQNILRANVFSKKPLDQKQMKNIEKALNSKLNRQILLENIIDSTIVGGIKITYEGKVLDNTINHFIQTLTESVKA